MSSKNNLAVKKDPKRAELIQVDRALESMRDAGFDLTAAAGEPVDNSIEAGASVVRIKTVWEEGKAKKISQIVFADNGKGIEEDDLPHILSMGYSTRYNKRDGLGRFGVGLKLATLSQARRLDVYTRVKGVKNVLHAFFDLDLIASRQQEYIEAEAVAGFPPEFAELVSTAKGEFPSGTMVIWSKVDRIVHGGTYGTGLEETLAGLTSYLARTYRQFLSKGLKIELDGKNITPHDPLFLLDNPRIAKIYKEDLKGKIIDEDKIEIDGHEVHVVVTLCPPQFRWWEGKGGAIDKDKKDISFLNIEDNEGKLSFLRNGREIYYDIVPRLLPSGVNWGDRYIGIEVRFPAILDEYFQVRHVKRGAEPVSKLREQLRSWLQRPIKAARKEIRALWGEVKNKEHEAAGDHGQAHEAVKKVEETAPKGQAGQDLSDEQANSKVDDLMKDMGVDPATEPDKAAAVKQKVAELPIMLADASWPGKELFEITHLNRKAVIKINHRHPFIKEIYDPVKALAATKDPTAISPEEVIATARKIEGALDVLFMAYAKAENMDDDPDAHFSDLRSYWGQFAQAYVLELLKDV